MVRQASEVILSPGGGLGFLPFEAMTFEGHRLDERCVVSRGSTVGLLQFVRRERVQCGPPVILATGMNDGTVPADPYPDLDGDGDEEAVDRVVMRAAEASFVDRRKPQIPRLRHAEREAREVAEFYGRGEALVGKEALADVTRKTVPGALIWHCAVHGHQNQSDPLSSYLLMQPFLQEEGHLQAKSFFGERKMTTELAMLTACNSYGTDLLTGGESALGFHSTLIFRNVRTVIVTTQPVEDRLARKMGVAFHRHLRTGIQAHEALRQVRLDALAGAFGESGTHMKNSHAFVLHGDPRMTLPEELLDSGTKSWGQGSPE